MTQIPEKIDRLPYDIAKLYSTAVLGEYYKRDAIINQLIDYLTTREELGDARHKELTSRIDTIEGNQQVQAQHIQNLRGGWTDVEIRKSAFSWPQKGDLIYCFNSRGDILEQRWNDSVKQNGKLNFLGIFPTREAAEAYKAKLLADNQQ